MPRRATLYIDIDDTIIAQVLPGAGFDLRPCVMTQLTVLSKVYDCCWLTSWPYAISWELDSQGVPTLVVLENIGDCGYQVPFAAADLIEDPVETARRLAPRITSVLQNGDSRRFDFR